MKRYILSLLILFVLQIATAQNSTIKNLKLNNAYSHYGVVFYKNNKVVFSSNSANNKKRKGFKTKTPFFSLYQGDLNEDNEIVNVEPVLSDTKGRLNVSSVCFSNDGRYIYVTTNNTGKNKNYKRKGTSVNIHIERGEYIEGKGWSNFEILPFCDKNFNYGHPALSPDGRELYFVSNIPEAKGQTDIFKVEVLGNNTYGEVKNIGEMINSNRKEMFPFISQDNVLYFSSNRPGGIGSLDVYKYDLNNISPEIKAEILPSPINSRGDDFSFVLKDNNKEGFFSSRRGRKDKGKGEDDIYYFQFVD